ncbi:hypothetical protein LFYK43_13150 [Ligilactobacillus salitolerans]|uniref:Helicase Helix-turn-helix domain-containing protein n=1 Tax=Ligilactobacillus salitolerans TaxID=1808352 RepID=A0A401ITL3_9LACO|nr:helix-turn-helix domain-containing protein [Ligilactobacillus salitolerans]GBG94856.1 hypothetical protein LFYK43_13150 [Ligilactobacillus salitolerans]
MNDNDWWLLFFTAKQKRRPAVIRQLLTKRLSSSTLFWGLRYQLLEIIGFFPKLEASTFDQGIQKLVEQGFLSQDPDDTVKLTERGRSKKQELLTGPTLGAPRFFCEHRVTEINQMLKLIVQVASEASYGNSRYYVAVDNFECQQMIKQWLHQYDLQTLHKNILLELKSFLENESPQKAWIFCAQFSGHQVLPKTVAQMAQQTGLTTLEIKIILLDLTSRFASHLLQKNSLLAPMIKHFENQNVLFKKSRQALQLFLNGKSIQQIAQYNAVKESTVREYLLNAAILERDFPFASFFTDQEEELLTARLPADIDQWSYRELMSEQVQVSFFNYRLVAIKRSHEEFGQ